jgi:hypothetical protein
MKTYVLGIPANDVVRLLCREIAAANGQPELYYDVWEDYVVTEDFDPTAFTAPKNIVWSVSRQY